MKPTMHENLRKHLLNVALAAHKLRLYRTVMQARGHIIAKGAREGLGLTQREMAKQLGIDHTYLSRIENDKSPLTVPLAEAILGLVDGQDAVEVYEANGCAFSSAEPISPTVNANGKAAKALPLLILILVGVIGFEPTTSWSRTKNGPASHHVYCESINANGLIFQARNSPLPNSNRPPKPTPNQSRIGRVSAARATAPSAPAPRQEGVPS